MLYIRYCWALYSDIYLNNFEVNMTTLIMQLCIELKRHHETGSGLAIRPFRGEHLTLNNPISVYLFGYKSSTKEYHASLIVASKISQWRLTCRS